MKEFKDLEFKEHEGSWFDTHAKVNFENGYGVSVINGESAYCDSDTYELAVLYNDSLTYNTKITDNVIGYQTAEEVTELMKQVQELT